MKKLILTAAAAMMVFASCTKTKVESIDGPKEIAFKKIEGAMTKADPDPTQFTGTMGVFAYLNSTTTEYFVNTKFSKDGTYWKGDKYWPLNGQALDFVVYAPHTEDILNYNIEYDSDDRILTFTIPNNKDSQTDYLYGSEYYDNNDTNSDDKDDGFIHDKDGVAVSLKHALAKITVNVDASADNVFTITYMTLNETNQGGTIDIVYDDDDDDDDSYYDEANDPSCSASINNINMTLFNNPENPVPVTIGVTEATTKSCLVFPGDQTSFTIKYKMKDLGNTVLTTTLDLQTLNPSSTWDSGKHYIYNLTLTANEILFNPSVVDWGNPTYTDVEIDKTDDVNL